MTSLAKLASYTVIHCSRLLHWVAVQLGGLHSLRISGAAKHAAGELLLTLVLLVLAGFALAYLVPVRPY